MFGYICVNREELSEEDRLTYQSFYCGLCQCLHRRYGIKGQLFLNYDITFLALLLTGLYEPQNIQGEYRCKLHPFHRRTVTENVLLEYAADMNVLLAYHKLRDDWEDEKRLWAFTMVKMLEGDYRSLESKYPRQIKAVETYISKLGACEKHQETNLDIVSNLTGEMLGELLVFHEDEWQRELRTLGFFLGKFIYLMDAYEDLTKDLRRGNYNPLIRLSMQPGYEELCKKMLNYLMAETTRSFERLPILMNAEILRNILYSGVWNKYELMQRKKFGDLDHNEEKR